MEIRLKRACFLVPCSAVIGQKSCSLLVNHWYYWIFTNSLMTFSPPNSRKSNDFRLFLVHFAQNIIFGTVSLQLFYNLSNVPKDCKYQYIVFFSIFNHYVFTLPKILQAILCIVDFYQTIGYNKDDKIYESERAK